MGRSGAFSIRVSGRVIAGFEASHVQVVRRHVRSKRRWHRDYLLAHLVPVVVRLARRRHVDAPLPNSRAQLNVTINCHF